MDKNIQTKLDKFLESFEHKKDVVAVLVCGSYITGHPNSHSDLDVHLILDERCDYRERGNRIVDGLLIEYFSNTKRQLLKYFEDDFKTIRPMSQTQFATGEIIFDKTGEARQLKDIAIKQLDEGFEKVDNTPFPLALYGVWDSLDDLQGLIEDNRADYDFIYYNKLNNLLGFIFWDRKIPYNTKTVLGHISNPITRQKYLLKEIKDNTLCSLVTKSITAPTREEKLEAYTTLANGLLEKYNFDISTFAFKSKEDI